MLAAALFSSYFQLEAGFDFGVDPDRHHELTQFLDWLGQQNAPAIDADALGTERALDIDIGHGTEEFARFAGPRRNLDRQAFDPVLHLDRFGPLGIAPHQADALFMLEGAQVFGIG